MNSHQISSFENSFGTDFYSNLAKQQPCFGTTIPEKQFKRSENTEPYFAQKQKLNIKQFQFQQKILLLKLQSKIDSIFNVLQNKVLSRKNYAFQTLNELSSNSCNQYTQRSLSVEYLNSIFSKISNFHKRVQTKLLSKAFSNILLRNIYIARIQSQILKKKKSPTTEKRDSQMLRVNSKVDEDNSMRVSDLEDGPNYIHNAKAKNKELRKQKEQTLKNVSQYMSQFDQILTHHEQYINKRR